MRLLLFMMAAAIGCAPAFDPERVSADPGTFGHRVVTLMCKRLAFQADPTDVSGSKYRDACKGLVDMPPDAPPTLVALAANRTRLVTAIDFVVPEDVYDPLQAYLTSAPMLALYDDDTMSTSIASLGDMLAEMGGDPDAMAALSRMGTRNGYRPAEQAIGPAAPLTASPHIRAVMDSVLPSIIEGGASKSQWDALVSAVAFTLSNAAPQNDGTGSTAARIANDFLLTEHAELGETTPLPMVRRDKRGIAKIKLVNGAVPAPFSDRDNDTLADVDDSGNYVDAAGMPLSVAPPFPQSSDSPYEYFDLTKTVFGSMANDQVALLDPAKTTAVDLLRGASAMLGARTSQTRTLPNGSSITYDGYAADESPLLDMTYGFVQLLRDPNILDTLQLTEVLVEDHTSPAARLLENAIVIARMADEHPEAEIAADGDLWDDLMPHVRKILANPVLLRDLMRALERPEVRQLITRFRDQMKYKDRFDLAANQTVTGNFATVVDRTQPDTGFNRSLWQRLLALISDSNGAVECSKAGAQVKESTTGLVLATYPEECALFRVPNMAVFYLQSIVYAKDQNGMLLCETTAGAFGDTVPRATAQECAAINRRPRRKANFNYNWTTVVRTLLHTQGGDAYLETRSTIAGFRTHPTAEALNRVLFLPQRPQSIQDTSDPPKDKFGDLMGVKHAGTLPVWERDNFYDSVRPVLQAFADQNEEQIFVDIISVLHEHWSSASSNGVSYEPYIIRVFEGDLWPALTEHAAELNAITVNGKPFDTLVRNAGSFLVNPLPGLTDRRGNPMVSPWDLLADAYHAKRARMAASPAAQHWADSIRELVDLMFRADKTGNTYAFRSPHLKAATRGIVKLLRERLLEHQATGDRAQWVAQDLPAKITDFLTHPLLAAAADFIESQTAAGAPRTAFDALLHGVFDPVNAPDAYATMRVGAADLVQLAMNDHELVPIGRMAGRLLASDRTYLPTQLALLHRMHQADTESTLTNLVARLFKSSGEPGIPSISAIADGVGDVDRVNPGPPMAWSAADYAKVFQSVGSFMHEEKRGMPRFITIIKGRDL